MSRHLLDRVYDVRRQVAARVEHPGPPRREEGRAGPELVLSAGTHHRPGQGGCLLEVASLLAGEPWGDEPACAHPVIAALARSVNDQVPDQDRHLLIALVPAVIGTAADPADSLAEQWALTVRLVAWCARQVLPLTQQPEASQAAILAAEAWAGCPCASHAAVAAAAAKDTTAAGDFSDAAVAATATAWAVEYGAHLLTNAGPDQAAVEEATKQTWDCADEAVHAAACAGPGASDRVALLTGLLAEHARLTGRALPGPLSRADTARLGALIGTPPDPGASEDEEEDEYYAWREWLRGQRDGKGPGHACDTDREQGESVNGVGVATLQDRALRATEDDTHLERFVSEHNQG